MCNDHQMETPDWLQEKIKKMWEDGMFLETRCHPWLDIHENCEHVRPPVQWKDIKPIEHIHWAM